jgi:hypothetical protein
MNKRNFFKGLVALLAMPSTIYARIVSKPKPAPFHYFFKREEGFVVQVDVRSPQDVREGMLVEYGSQLLKIVKKAPASFLYKGQVAENLRQDKFFVKNLYAQRDQLLVLFGVVFPNDAIKFYVRA